MFGNRLGTIDSQPANIVLGGGQPASNGQFDRSIEHTIDLTSVASSNAISRSADSTLTMTDSCSTTTPHHKSASSALTMTDSARSSIRSLTASSAISLTSTAHSSTTDVSASSPISLTSTARATQLDKVASDSISLTSVAMPGLYKRVASSPISLTQDAVCVGGSRAFSASSPLSLTSTATTTGPKHKSASSPITLTSSAQGEGPVSASASNSLVLTDAALSGIWTATAASIIVLADVGHAGTPYTVSASSAISLTSVVAGFNLHVYAESPISLVSFVEDKEKYRSGESAISLTSTATAQVVHAAISTLTLTDLAACNNVGKQVISTLTLTQTAHNSNVKLRAEASVLSFTQEVHTNIKMVSLEDIITLQQDLHVLRPWYGSAVSQLIETVLVFDLDTFTFVPVESGLSQSVAYTLIGLKTAKNIVSFAQFATKEHVRADGTDLDASNTLSLTHTAQLNKTAAGHSVLSLNQSATAEVANAQATSTLDTLDVEADFIITRNQITQSGLAVQQSVAFVLEKSSTRCTYSPFVGGGSDPNAPTPPPTTYPAAGVTSGFRLQYPHTGTVTDELVLRSPEFGNTDRLEMTRVNRETRGGTLIVFADPIWPKIQTLTVTITGLSNTQAQDLLDFFYDHLGEDIKLIDWEDRVWVGFIANPQDPIVQDGPGCKYTASFEFQGEKV